MNEEGGRGKDEGRMAWRSEAMEVECRQQCVGPRQYGMLEVEEGMEVECMHEGGGPIQYNRTE